MSSALHAHQLPAAPLFLGNNCMNLKTLCACRSMPQLVTEVVKGVLDRLDRPALHVADYPVDMEQRLANVMQRFADQAASSAAVLGLHGMGGIGKTTLAKAVFNALQHDFAGNSCFLEVGHEAHGPTLQRLQQQMLRELCGVEMEVKSMAAGRAELQRRLPRSKVLLVIDDLWLPKQRDALLVPPGPGSRVVLTTRDAQLLDRPGIVSQLVKVLNSDAALELLSRHAFMANKPPAGCSELVAEAVEKCAGLPLTLKVVGAFLWNQQDQKSWRAALARLQAAQSLTGCGTADDELWGVLRVSYDTLGQPEQRLFLDIACCLLGKQQSAVIAATGETDGEVSLRNLRSRSLVSVGRMGQIEMHDQLRDMAREIVVMENRQRPALRSRVWLPEALHLFNGKQVGDLLQTSVHGSLRMWKLTSSIVHRHVWQSQLMTPPWIASVFPAFPCDQIYFLLLTTIVPHVTDLGS